MSQYCVLVLDIIRLAMKDATRETTSVIDRYEALKFFRSAKFERWCDALRLNPDCIRQKIINERPTLADQIFNS